MEEKIVQVADYSEFCALNYEFYDASGDEDDVVCVRQASTVNFFDRGEAPGIAGLCWRWPTLDGCDETGSDVQEGFESRKGGAGSWMKVRWRAEVEHRRYPVPFPPPPPPVLTPWHLGGSRDL